MKVNNIGPSPGVQAVVTQGKTSDQEFKNVLDKAVASKSDKQLMDAAKQFEALFMYQMFSQMRQTVEKGGLFEESLQSDIFQGLFDQEVSTQAAQKGTVGLAEMIYRQLKRKGENVAE